MQKPSKVVYCRQISCFWPFGYSKALGLHLSADLDVLGANLDALGGNLGGLGSIMGALGANLDALWATWTFQSFSWAALGDSWARLGGPKELSWRSKAVSATQLGGPKPSAEPILEASRSLRCQFGDALPSLTAPLGGTKQLRNNPPRIRATRSKSIDR